MVTGPRKITINRILIKAEIRKCFAGTDWETQNLSQIIDRIADKLGVYGDVNEQVRESVEEQVRKKLQAKGKDPDSHGNEQVNVYGGANAGADTEEVNVYGQSEVSVDALLFNPPPPPRVIATQDSILASPVQSQHKIEDDSSDEEDLDLYANDEPASPVSIPSRASVGFDWDLSKLKRTVEMQFTGATSWRTVINSVKDLDPNYTDKIALELFTRIQSTSKPFSHEEVGNMALSQLDKMYIELDAGNRKRDPTSALLQQAPPAQPAQAQKEGISFVGVADGDNELVSRLQQENFALKAELEKVRETVRVQAAEIDRLNRTLATMEQNSAAMADILKQKQSEVSDGKRLVNDLSQQTLNYSDEGLAVRAQMEEIRQFAIRSQQANRQASASMAQGSSQAAMMQEQMMIQQQMILEGAQREGQQRQQAPARVQAQPSRAMVVNPRQGALVNNGRVDSTIPDELHAIHFPDPNRVGPWQTTNSYTKTKRGTTKAIVTWTLVDSRENRHVVTLEHNHYSFRGKGKRKVVIDNQVRMSEKSGNLNYRFDLSDHDTVTVVINNGENGFEYELMVNDLSFNQARAFYVELQQALQQSAEMQ